MHNSLIIRLRFTGYTIGLAEGSGGDNNVRMNIRMNAKKTTVSIVLGAMFLGAASLGLSDKSAAKTKPKSRKSRWGKLDLTGVKKREIVYKNKPHGFFNAPDYVKATMLLTDKFLASLGYLEGKPTIDTKGLNTPEIDLKGAGK